MTNKRKIGIPRFLGTNCDQDIWKWVENSGYTPEYLWFENTFQINDYEKIIIPGGFSYGDYLRCGALAARSPVMKSVKEFSEKGKPILGICNGFQILCEAQLLPGVLIRNKNLQFIDQFSELEVDQGKSFFGEKLQKGQTVNLPIAHGEGQFFAPSDDLKKIHDQNQIWLKYKNNPNGSQLDIAGITNEKGNVFGMMPHPERALYQWMGSMDGGFFL